MGGGGEGRGVWQGECGGCLGGGESGMIWGVSGWEEFAFGVWEVLRVGREGGKYGLRGGKEGGVEEKNGWEPGV